MGDVRDDAISFEEAVPVYKYLSVDIKRTGLPTVEETEVTNLGIGLRKKLMNDLKNAGMVCGGDSRKRRKTYRQQS